MGDSYSQWLEEAFRWSAASPCWSEDEVEGFVASFQRLAAQKRAERAESEDTLAALLKRLSTDGAAGLRYVGWTVLSRLDDTESPTVDLTSTVVAQLDNLIDELKAVETGSIQPATTDFDELRRWIADLETHVAAARAIMTTFPQLFAKMLSSPTTETPGQTLARVTAPVHLAEEMPELKVAADPKISAQNEEPPFDVITPPVGEIIVESLVRTENTDEHFEPVRAAGTDHDDICSHIEPPPPPDQPAIEPTPREDPLQWVNPLLARLHASASYTNEFDSPIVLLDAVEIDLAAAFWEQIRGADLAAAYWLSRAIEATGEEAPIPSNTLAAMQALEWLWDDPPTLSKRCFELPDLPGAILPEARLAVLGSAIRFALFAPEFVDGPYTAFGKVLNDRAPYEELEDVMAVARDYAHGYRPLEKRYVLAIASGQQKATAIADTTDKLKRWLETAPKRKMKKFGATDVFRTWTQTGGRMYTAAEPVIAGNVDEVAAVAKQADWWDTNVLVEDALNDDYKAVASRHAYSPIVGDARDQIWSKAKEFSALLKTWCEAVTCDSSERTAAPPQVPLLRDQLQGTAPTLIALLGRLQEDAGSAAEAAAVRHMHRQMAAVYSAVLISFPPAPAMPSVAASWYQEKQPTLTAMLMRRLHLVPGITIGDEIDVEERLPAIGLALATSASGTSPLETGREWLDNDDFRWIDRYLEAVGSTAAAQELRETARQRRAECERRLQDELTAAAREVEQAAIGTSLPNVEAESLREELDDIIPSEVLLFPPVLAQISRIRACCRKAVAAHAAELAERWRTLCGTLRAKPQSIARLSADIRATLENLDVRAAETLLQEVSAAIERPGVVEEDVLDALAFARRSGASNFESFLQLEPAISDWLNENPDAWVMFPQDPRYLPDRLRKGHTIAGGLLHAPPVERRPEAAQAFETWSKLRQNPFDRAGTTSEAIDHVATVLRFLGFAYDRHEGAPIAKPDYLFLTVKMSAGKYSPIPIWGSQSRDMYQVLVLRKIRSFSRIRECIAALPHHKEALLVMVVDHLEPAERRQLAAYTHAEQDPILALDDVLMLFLATSVDHRLKMFFDCSLPFSAANPYLAQRDGLVAPEMFRGHEEAVRKLMDRNGTCFICGGRQLGKSALQNYIQREFDLRAPNCHVWYINIKEIFNPRERQSVAALWNLLQDRFEWAGLLAGISKKANIATQLKQAFDNRPTLEVTIFLDEADDLLEAMIHDGRSVWTALTSLMDQTQRRLKIVYAGNFHISRFAALRNQSATILGTPIEIGPMEFAAASDLILTPLVALGYRFREDRAILDILSLTHRHASLLQLFMHELLAAKMKTRESGPPYWIETADVEKIYASQREHMAQRVELTLQLDPEYRALAFAMLLEQEEGRDFRVTYGTSELRQMAQVLWQEGFEKLTNADVEARLNEMRTLGIVVRSGDRFRLSGRHVVELFGNSAKLHEGVEDLAHEKPRGKFNESGVHGWIASGPTRYSPLTLVQERLLQLPQTHVRLLFLSRAGGLDDVTAAFETLVNPAGNGETHDCTVPPESFGRETVDWLRDFRRKQAPGTHAILLQIAPPETAPALLLQHIAGVQAYSRNLEDPKKTFQFVLVLPPNPGWSWLQNGSTERRPFEETALTSVLWDDLGIRSRFDDLGKMPNAQAVENVKEATSGWHFLLQVLFDLWPKREDSPAVACASLASQLSANSAIASDFAIALGLSPDSPPASVFRELIASGEPLRNTDAVELFGEPAIQFLQCYALIAARPTAEGPSLFVDPLAARIWTATTAG